MVPHFFAMDRIKFARWLPFYLSDMNMLETNHPEVYKEFINGNIVRVTQKNLDGHGPGAVY